LPLTRIVLASRSPQRRAILEQLGIAFDVAVAEVDERENGPPEQTVTHNALLKARAASSAAGLDRSVLAVDTVVALDGVLYGKPLNAEEARSHLTQLSGREHEVWSGLALIEQGHERTGTARTAVRFAHLDDQTIEWYLESEEWRDRAGGYAIQGRGAALVESIDGDYWNVVGLPVALMLQMAPQLLHRFGDG
jgi:septum formation protein